MSKIVKSIKSNTRKLADVVLNPKKFVKDTNRRFKRDMQKYPLLRVVVIAAAIYFGGAALVGAMGTGGAAAAAGTSGWAGATANLSAHSSFQNHALKLFFRHGRKAGHVDDEVAGVPKIFEDFFHAGTGDAHEADGLFLLLRPDEADHAHLVLP